MSGPVLHDGGVSGPVLHGGGVSGPVLHGGGVSGPVLNEAVYINGIQCSSSCAEMDISLELISWKICKKDGPRKIL